LRAQRKDGNHDEIVKALEDNGYRVDRHWLPDPFDILVRRINSPVGLCVEIKTATGRLEDSQTKALEAGSIVVVRSPEEALAAAARWL
jgi:hypothetical protein